MKICSDNTNAQACSRKQWDINPSVTVTTVKPTQTVPVYENRKPYRIESVFVIKIEYSSDDVNVNMINTVNKLLVVSVNYRNYRFIQKSA